MADQAPLDKATFVKKGLETARSYKSKRKQKATVKEIDFFERDAVVIDEIPTPKESHAIDYQAAMLKSLENTPSGRRPLRLDQDGPWSVSVAENPDDARSYSLYIKSAFVISIASISPSCSASMYRMLTLQSELTLLL